ncbi:hypothetical protein [Streptomyces sp. CBMA123]|uniref:hypothetical protein n=1 Tax=Streptomyces sp. CBMA123 TaxID=1896313 RepID=UPI001661D7F7|nr:hypothetical protein [Streptomyces sp. CBMA123]MBD0688930.1 hypothetical protein [Streptomyces sp. CBMA123]
MAMVWSPSWARSLVEGGPSQRGPAGPLGLVVRVHRGFRPVPWRARTWLDGVAAVLALAVCLALDEWWPAPMVAAVAVVLVSGYGLLRPAPGLRSVRVHEGGLALVGADGGEQLLPWERIEATEYSPGGRRGEPERGRIWPAGADEPLVLAQLHGLEGLFREVDERLSPGLRAALHEALRTEGSVRFARGRLTVTAGGLVHRPPHPPGTTETYRWAEVHSARASGLGELEIRTCSAGLPLTLPVLNARAAAEFLEGIRSRSARICP